MPTAFHYLCANPEDEFGRIFRIVYLIATSVLPTTTIFTSFSMNAMPINSTFDFDFSSDLLTYEKTTMAAGNVAIIFSATRAMAIICYYLVSFVNEDFAPTARRGLLTISSLFSLILMVSEGKSATRSVIWINVVFSFNSFHSTERLRNFREVVDLFDVIIGGVISIVVHYVFKDYDTINTVLIVLFSTIAVVDSSLEIILSHSSCRSRLNLDAHTLEFFGQNGGDPRQCNLNKAVVMTGLPIYLKKAPFDSFYRTIKLYLTEICDFEEESIVKIIRMPSNQDIGKVRVLIELKSLLDIFEIDSKKNQFRKDKVKAKRIHFLRERDIRIDTEFNTDRLSWSNNPPTRFQLMETVEFMEKEFQEKTSEVIRLNRILVSEKIKTVLLMNRLKSIENQIHRGSSTQEDEVFAHRAVFSPMICNVKIQKFSKKELGDDINRIATLALTACEDTNKQLADLDEEVQISPIVVKLAGAIRNTMSLASESRMFAENILNGDEEIIRSNDRLYREVTETFMKVREVTYNLITLWNENCQTIKYPKKTPEDVQEIVTLQKLENPFPSHLHLSIKLQPRLGVVVRDIQDSRGSYRPDIGSIIAYALSAVDYNKTAEQDDTVSMDSENISSIKDFLNDAQEGFISPQHLEAQFEDASASYYVKMFYAEKFQKLRELLIAEGEETFIRSLSNSTFWTPQGGKSGSFFYRTQDDRFVVKQMSRFEIQSFAKFAPNYFDYLTTSATESKLTTLCKVYGVFRIGYKSRTSIQKIDVLVMENLFYNHNVSQVWSVRGSLLNRLSSSTGKSPNEIVLLDENFVKDLWNQQLYVLPQYKAAMNQAISNDSHFLSSQYIMDYSLLVGVDKDDGKLVLGLVNYMKMYTLDKNLESWVKIVAIPGAHLLPTILSPEMYCARFSEAIDSYFPVVPDQ